MYCLFSLRENINRSHSTSKHSLDCSESFVFIVFFSVSILSVIIALVLNLVLCYPQKLDINEMPFLLTEVLKAKRYICMEVHCKLVHNVSCPKNRKYKTVDEKKRGGFQIANKERIPLWLESFRQPGNSPFSVPHLIGFTHNLMFLQQCTR